MYVQAEGVGTELVTYIEEPAPPQAGGPATTTPTPKNPTTGENAVPAPATVVRVSEKTIVKRGTFKQVIDCLESYKAAGITTYVIFKPLNLQFILPVM